MVNWYCASVVAQSRSKLYTWGTKTNVGRVSSRHSLTIYNGESSSSKSTYRIRCLPLDWSNRPYLHSPHFGCALLPSCSAQRTKSSAKVLRNCSLGGGSYEKDSTRSNSPMCKGIIRPSVYSTGSISFNHWQVYSSCSGWWVTSVSRTGL